MIPAVLDTYRARRENKCLVKITSNRSFAGLFGSIGILDI